MKSKWQPSTTTVTTELYHQDIGTYKSFEDCKINELFINKKKKKITPSMLVH